MVRKGASKPQPGQRQQRPDAGPGGRHQQARQEIGHLDVVAVAHEIHADAEYLADALLEEGVIEEKATDGMYTVIAGERADYTLDNSWWCVTKGGEMTSVGMNEQPIADGDSFEITNTPS